MHNFTFFPFFSPEAYCTEYNYKVFQLCESATWDVLHQCVCPSYSRETQKQPERHHVCFSASGSKWYEPNTWRLDRHFYKCVSVVGLVSELDQENEKHQIWILSAHVTFASVSKCAIWDAVEESIKVVELKMLKRYRHSREIIHFFPFSHVLVGYVWVFIVAVLPLLSIPAVVGLILIYCYVKPSKNSCIPKAMVYQLKSRNYYVYNIQHIVYNESLSRYPTLTTVCSFSCPSQEIIKVTEMVRILNPEDPQALPISWIFTDDCKSEHQESVEDLSQGYYGRSDGKFKEGLLGQIMDEGDQYTPPVRDLYSTAAKLEEVWESLTETECCSDGLTLDTTSFRDTILPSDQIRNPLHSVVFVYDENMFDEYFEQTEPEAETESLWSDSVFGSNYEARPDPRWMPKL